LTYHAELKENKNDAFDDKMTVATPWSLHKDAMESALYKYNCEDADVEHDEVRAFVRTELKKVKIEECRQLFEALRTKVFELELFEDKGQGSTDCDDHDVAQVQDDEGYEDEHRAKKAKVM
jgi:hypothetical protein